MVNSIEDSTDWGVGGLGRGFLFFVFLQRKKIFRDGHVMWDLNL